MEELREKMTATARYTLSIPELFPMVGFRRDQVTFPLSNEHHQGQDCMEKLRKAKSTVQTGDLYM